MTANPAGMIRERIQVGITPTCAVGSKPRREKERLENTRMVRKKTSMSDVTALTRVFALSPSASYPKLSAR